MNNTTVANILKGNYIKKGKLFKRIPDERFDKFIGKVADWFMTSDFPKTAESLRSWYSKNSYAISEDLCILAMHYT